MPFFLMPNTVPYVVYIVPDKKGKGIKSRASKHTVKEEPVSVERSVDEIIASLKENANSKQYVSWLLQASFYVSIIQ